MSLDLERALMDMAGSVHDDELAERMNGRVYRMVAQVRRRRVARTTATGAVGVGAAAALAVGAVNLAGQGGGRAPIGGGSPTGEPTSSSTLDDWPDCGEPVPAATQEKDLMLAAQVPGTVSYGEPLPLVLTLTDAMSMSVDRYSPVDVAVAQDGVVVGTAQVDPDAFGLTPGVDPSQTEVTVTSCGGDTPLGDGDYELVAGVRLDLADGRSRTAISPAAPFAITGEDTGIYGDPAEREAALTDLLAGATRSTADFPVCGSAVPPDADAPVTVSLELDDRTYAPGESFTVPVGVQRGTAVPAGAVVTANNPVVVLTRDGVVVGRADPADASVPVALTADGSGSVDTGAEFRLCSLPGADAPETALPAGHYQAYATFTVTIDDPSAGKDSAPWEPVVVFSAPVDVTLG